MQNIAMMQPQRKTQYHYQLTLLWYIEVPLVAFEKIPFGRSVVGTPWFYKIFMFSNILHHFMEQFLILIDFHQLEIMIILFYFLYILLYIPFILFSRHSMGLRKVLIARL